MFFESNDFKEYFHLEGNGMGALRRYSNDLLNIQLLCDKGMVTFEISGLNNNDEFIEFEILMNYYLSNKSNTKNIPTKNRYGFDEQIEFLSTNWDTISRDFNKVNYEQTKLNIYSR